MFRLTRGLLSAWGLHQAADREIKVKQILKLLDDSISEELDQLREGRSVHRSLFELRLKGQDSSIEIEAGQRISESELREAFETRYRELYGDARPVDREIEWVALRLELVGRAIDLEHEYFERGGLVEKLTLEQDGFSTLLLEKGWRIFRGTRGSIRLEWEGQNESGERAPAVVEAELFRRRF